MVAHLVRLKLTLLRNGLRRSAWQVVGLVLASVYGLGALTVLLGALIALAGLDVTIRGPALVVGGSVLVAGWWLVPLVAFGVDATLDPARFALFPIRRRDLVAGLGLAALVGVPGLLTTLLALATVGVWWDHPAALPVALLGALLALASAVLGSRAVVAVAAGVLARRRVREVVGALAVVGLVLVGPTVSGSIGRGGTVHGPGLGTLRAVARVAGWTPFGLPWAAAGDAAAGQWTTAALRLLATAGCAGLLAWVWAAALGRATVVVRSTSPRRRERGLGWFARLPGTPTGAVAARCLTYWLRDPRYAMSFLIVPLLPLVFALVDPTRTLVLVAAPLAGFVLGWGIVADVANDGSAFWLHVAAPLAGRADRWGRASAALGLGTPAVALMSALATLVSGRRDALVPSLALGLGVLVTSVAVSSVMSALVVYRVRQAGENPFTTQQGASMVAVVSQMVGWAAIGVLAAPTLVLGVLALVRHDAPLGWAALVTGPALGAVVVTVGVRVGGRVLDRRAPDLLTSLRSFT